MFLNPDFLLSHYKRRHLAYYTEEIRPKEDELLKGELVQIVKQMKNNSTEAE